MLSWQKNYASVMFNKWAKSLLSSPWAGRGTEAEYRECPAEIGTVGTYDSTIFIYAEHHNASNEKLPNFFDVISW